MLPRFAPDPWMHGFSDADSKRGALLAPRRHVTFATSQPKSYTDDAVSFNRQCLIDVEGTLRVSGDQR
ncbi:hypothetical protein PSAB6_70455 [Paraburkholderia sabiae]|jgi:hypothetical protein|nr:hypothetical protein PSAB6_70455 [Paraburkholderia sabiae]